MKTISISNIKGGVAKTTTASVLAAGLQKRGAKVLLIDSDPQMNLTLCYKSEHENNRTLYLLYTGKAELNEIITPIKENMDLVSGDFELCSADMEFFKKAGSLKILSKALKKSENSYDYVIIDTPPNMGFLSLNAFIASDYIITPVSADNFSLKACRLLKQTLDEVKEDIEREIPVLGILLTRYSGRTKVARLLQSSLDTAAQLLNSKLYNSKIRQGVSIQESQIAKTDLFTYAPNAKVTSDYNDFIEETLERLERIG